MKNPRPSILILLGSLTIALLSIFLNLVIHLWIEELNTYTLLIIPIVTGVFTFLLFYFLLKNFIYNRLSLIYRSIQKSSKPSEINSQFIDAMLQNVEKEVKTWKEDKNTEITRLRDQDAFRREFLGNLAHELKTPVFSIQGFLLTLLDGGMDDPEISRSFLERAAKATDRMASILEDLDEITKLEVEELKMQFRSFDLIELINEIFEALEITAEAKKIKLHFNKFYSPIYVTADRSKIGQVFTNLLSNSIFYGNENGETIVSIIVFDNLVTIDVSDNGPGIDEKHHSRLFERFYRVEKSRNRNEGGSGLGLAIVKHILESHGQHISVRSKPGQGSTFSFSLDKSQSAGPVSSRGIPLK